MPENTEHTIDLTQWNIQRPEKVIWRFPVDGLSEENVLERLRGKSLRQFLKNAESVLEQNRLRYEHVQLDKSAFEKWLEFYKEQMAANEYDTLATPEWYDKKMAQGFQVEGLFFYQESRLVGTAIFTTKTTEKITLSYKASERLNVAGTSSASLGALIDYYFLRHAAAGKFQIISAGRSRNAFGVINTFGYVDYKLRFGFQPLPDPKSTPISETPVDANGTVLFGGYHQGQWSLIGLKPRGHEFVFEASRYSSPELPFVEIEY